LTVVESPTPLTRASESPPVGVDVEALPMESTMVEPSLPSTQIDPNAPFYKRWVAQFQGRLNQADIDAAPKSYTIDTSARHIEIDPNDPFYVRGWGHCQELFWRTLAPFMRPKSGENNEIELLFNTLPYKERYAVFIVSFVTLLREGIEVTFFLGGTTNVPPQAIPLPALVGIVCGVLVGVFLYYTGKMVKSLSAFFYFMAFFIMLIAAGQLSLMTHAFYVAGMFGKMSVWRDERHWWQLPVWDTTDCCSTAQDFWSLMRAIFGYQDRPLFFEVFLYFFYWFCVICIFFTKMWRGTLFDADPKHTREMKEKREMAKNAKHYEQVALLKGKDDTNRSSTDEPSSESLEEVEKMKGKGKDSLEATGRSSDDSENRPTDELASGSGSVEQPVAITQIELTDKN
jgi:hypothetical protein